jgi:hypothetical protein
MYEYVVNGASEPEETAPPLSKNEARRIKRQLAPVAGLGGTFVFLLVLWLFFPVWLKAGIAVLSLLPFPSLLILWRYRAYFKAAQKGPLDSAWTYLIIFVPAPPLVLFITFLKSFNFIFPIHFWILVPVIAVAAAIACLSINPKLRSKTAAIGLTLFAAAMIFSGVLETNCLVNVSTVENYTVTVKNSGGSPGPCRSAPAFYLIVGPVGEIRNMKLQVPWDVYRSAQTGRRATLSLQRGLWGIAWYEIDL